MQQFDTSDIKSLGWMRVAKGYELKVFLQNGKIVKFDGFKEAVRRRQPVLLRCLDNCASLEDRLCHLFVCRTTTTLLTSLKDIMGRTFQRQRSV